LGRYQLKRPNFTALIKEFIAASDKLIVYEPPFNEWLFLTVRALFDAKYSEHLMYDTTT